MASNFLENRARLNKFVYQYADFIEECAENLPGEVDKAKAAKRAADIRSLSEPIILRGRNG